MKTVFRCGLAAAVLLLLGSCATIPPESAELSVELGKSIAALEKSYLSLLGRYFDDKRAVIDRFVLEEYAPAFAEEFFSNPMILGAWNTIVDENNEADRLRFILLVGPRLALHLEEKKREYTKPLDEIEKLVESEIRAQFAEVIAINSAITSFLVSASKVEENRNRYLEMVGVTDELVGHTISEVDTVVGNLVAGARSASEYADKAEAYLAEAKKIVDSLKK